MVKDPRPIRPDPSDQDETVELLRALARRGGARATLPAAPPRHEAEKLDSLRGLAERLDDKLRAPAAGDAPASAPQPPPADRPAPSAPTARRRDAALTRPPDAPGAARGPWAEFVAALPTARSLVPRLSAARVLFVLVALAVLAIAGVGRVIGPRVATENPGAVPQPGAAPAPPPVASRPGDLPALDIASITKAMAACDEEAARNPGSLYFLVLPLTEVVRGKHDWRAVALQSVVNAYFLLSDKHALEGIGDKSLALRGDRYTFAVLDNTTGMTYSWTSATGLSRLSRPDASTPKTIKLGFDFSAQQTGPQWSAPFTREPGTCYSVNVLVVQ